MATFRDPVARDRAWGRYFAKRGLCPLTRDVRPVYNPLRLAAYQVKRALAGEVRA